MNVKCSNTLFKIIHEVLATDTIEFGYTIVEAKSRKDALELFLKHIHSKNKKLYKWLQDPCLNNVANLRYYTK